MIGSGSERRGQQRNEQQGAAVTGGSYSGQQRNEQHGGAVASGGSSERQRGQRGDQPTIAANVVDQHGQQQVPQSAGGSGEQQKGGPVGGNVDCGPVVKDYGVSCDTNTGATAAVAGGASELKQQPESGAQATGLQRNGNKAGGGSNGTIHAVYRLTDVTYDDPLAIQRALSGTGNNRRCAISF